MKFVRFEEMNPLQRRLHNAAIVLECEGDEHGFVELQRDAIMEIQQMRDCSGRVIAAFEELGRTSDTIDLLKARSRCENAMLELQQTSKTPNV